MSFWEAHNIPRPFSKPIGIPFPFILNSAHMDFKTIPDAFPEPQLFWKLRLLLCRHVSLHFPLFPHFSLLKSSTSAQANDSKRKVGEADAQTPCHASGAYAAVRSPDCGACLFGTGTDGNRN